MADTETDIISHLLDVESEVAELISNAQLEADKRIAAARHTADENYKALYTKMNASLEDAYNQKIDAFDKAHAEAIASYKDEISKTAKDQDSFNSVLDKYLSIA